MNPIYLKFYEETAAYLGITVEELMRRLREILAEGDLKR
jgi:DNA-binding Lrp family transcriptional regulator